VSTAPRRVRLRATRVAAVLLLLVPILELMTLIAVGRALGGWPTFLLLVATSLLGAWLIRHEGSRAWAALSRALQSGRMPARELADGMLVLVGGTLLLFPGFLTDLLGLVLVLPFTRPAARRLLEVVIAHRLLAQAAPFGGPPGRTGSSGGDDVIEGEIIDE